MSFSELLVIFVVIFLLIKPDDLPQIIKKIQELREFFIKTKEEIISYFDPEVTKEKFSITNDIEQINFYLEKIAKLGGEYEGEYSLHKIREKYHDMVKKTVKSQVKKK